ncbi:hypothetical protein KAX22_02920, partial [bacterium]|nr:hypothetical protein [bacterium]
GIKKGTDDWLTFFDLAAICSGTIPTDVISDDRLLLSLPIIFRTLRETETDKDGLRKLIEAIRRDLS